MDLVHSAQERVIPSQPVSSSCSRRVAAQLESIAEKLSNGTANAGHAKYVREAARLIASCGAVT